MDQDLIPILMFLGYGKLIRLPGYSLVALIDEYCRAGCNYGRYRRDRACGSRLHLCQFRHRTPLCTHYLAVRRVVSRAEADRWDVFHVEGISHL